MQKLGAELKRHTALNRRWAQEFSSTITPKGSLLAWSHHPVRDEEPLLPIRFLLFATEQDERATVVNTEVVFTEGAAGTRAPKLFPHAQDNEKSLCEDEHIPSARSLQISIAIIFEK